jgi:ribose transport system substrate-binding protein
MKALRRTVLLIFAALFAFSLFGCSQNSLSVEEKKINIKVIVKKRNHDFWAVVQQGAEAAGKEFNVNVDFDGPTDEKDIEGQIAMVYNAIKARSDAIVLAASDYTLLVPAAEQAMLEKIPTVIIDSNIKSDQMVSFIGTDNVDAGRILGESLVKKVGENCTIGVISFVKGAATAVEREQGFGETLKNYPGIRVLGMEYCNSDETLAKKQTEDFIKNNPDIDAIVCLNAYSTAGAARAIEGMEKSGAVKLVGVDSTPEEVGYMEKGVIQSLVIQNPFKMGYLGVKSALDAIKNIPVEKNINTGSTVIDQDNMYLPENQKLVFPFTN